MAHWKRDEAHKGGGWPIRPNVPAEAPRGLAMMRELELMKTAKFPVKNMKNSFDKLKFSQKSA